jgi:hypothetical protein
MQRCKAKSKRSGEQCKNYALKEWGVCRMHGAHGGPKTIQGHHACKKASFKHGLYSYEALQELQECNQLIKRSQLILSNT